MKDIQIELEQIIKKMKFEYSDREKKVFLLMVNKNSPTRTTKLYLSVLNNVINEAEKINKREWMDFTREMVDSAFVEIQSKSIITLQSYLSIIKHYLSNTTPHTDEAKLGYLYTLGMDKEALREYTNSIGEQYRYLTPDELDDIIENKPMDSLGKSLFVLLYLGVKGNGFSEICSIMDKDINLQTGEIKVDGKLLCTIPQKYIKHFEETINSDTYIKYDSHGKALKPSKVNIHAPYFVKRRIGKSTNPHAAPDSTLISNTLVDAKKGIKNPYITPISLYLSGEAYRLIERCGMKMPTNQDLKLFRQETGSTLSFVSMNTVCSIILEKLGIETP